MGVRVFVLSVSGTLMDGHICHQSTAHKPLSHVVDNQLALRLAVELHGKSDVKLTGNLGVFASFGIFHLVPKALALAARPGRAQE